MQSGKRSYCAPQDQSIEGVLVHASCCAPRHFALFSQCGLRTAACIHVAPHTNPEYKQEAGAALIPSLPSASLHFRLVLRCPKHTGTCKYACAL